MVRPRSRPSSTRAVTSGSCRTTRPTPPSRATTPRSWAAWSPYFGASEEAAGGPSAGYDVDQPGSPDDHGPHLPVGQCPGDAGGRQRQLAQLVLADPGRDLQPVAHLAGQDRKSTRLNSSHGYISYAVFCLKK